MGYNQKYNKEEQRPMMNIETLMEKALDQYVANNAEPPRAIYLGYKELRELEAKLCEKENVRVTTKNFQLKYCGIPIYHVAEASHLNMAPMLI